MTKLQASNQTYLIQPKLDRKFIQANKENTNVMPAAFLLSFISASLYIAFEILYRHGALI